MKRMTQVDPNKKQPSEDSPNKQSDPSEWSPGRTTNPELDPGEHAPERPEVPNEMMRPGPGVLREESLE